MNRPLIIAAVAGAVLAASLTALLWERTEAEERPEAAHS